MANHPDRANRYIISRTWDEVMAGAGAAGDAEAAFLPVMQAATQPETATFGEAACNGGGAEPFNYTTEGRGRRKGRPRKPAGGDA